MATVTGYTAARMKEIEDSAIVDARIDANGHLFLKRYDNTEVDAGPVAGTNVVQAADTDSFNMSVDGAGTLEDPWIFSGEVLGVKPQEVTDWDLATTPGTYYSTSAINSPTSGVANWFMGRVYNYPPGGRIIQEVRHANTDGNQVQFVRYWNGTTWSPWRLSGGRGRGTTATRNTLFPLPATDADRVALANRKILWYNTDTDWEESYYAVTGLSGLTAKGLMAGNASDWYPTGLGPEIILEPTVASSTINAGQYVNNWNGSVKRNGGATWFTHESDGINVLKPGIYDLSWWTNQQAGTGTADYHTRILTAANALQWVSNSAGIPLYSTIFTRIGAHYDSMYMQAGWKFRLLVWSGALNLHNVTTGSTNPTRGQMRARYIRPPLVSD